MIRKITFRILNNLSWRLKYDIQDKKVPLKNDSSDPRKLPYLRDMPYSISNLPTELGVGLRFYPLTGNTYHPFVLALKSAVASKSREEHAFEVLKMYAELVTFRNANDIMGFVEEEKVFSGDAHPYEFTYPWSTIPPLQMKQRYVGYARSENKRYGFDSDEYLEDMMVSNKKVKIETSRLISLLFSIEKNGYEQQDDDLLGCFVLINKDKWRWYVEGGQHRASVLAALGYERIPVHVRQIIRREDVHIWPAVLSGIYTEKAALSLFDRMFYVETPPVAKEWINYVNERYVKDQPLDINRHEFK